MKKQNERALFVVGGYGLGNSTRCAALIERLKSQNIDIDVATSNNGLWYFSESQHIRHLIPLKGLKFETQNGQVSILKTALVIPKLLFSLAKNVRTILRLQNKNKYTTIFVDSEYSCFLARPWLSAPLIAVNNVFFTLSDEVSKHSVNEPWWSKLNLAIEYLDLIVQKYFSDFRISPALRSNSVTESNSTLFCPPLVRAAFYKIDPPKSLSRALVIGSGSGIGVSQTTVDFLAKCEDVLEITVVGLDGPSQGKVKYLGRKKDISSLVSNCDFILSNGGFSTISEALVSRRPILIIPIPNHAEQIRNARFVEAFGLGIVTHNDRIQQDTIRLKSLVPT